jgi:transcriptional regulator with XRE-family HTH domain
MISLIENGKTQPSIERLQHIARQLEVDISELVEEVPREKMKSTLKQAIELWQQPEIQPTVDAAALLKPILEKNPSGYEAARMNEIYARIMYYLFVHENDEYNAIPENDWDLYIARAIELYSDLQMEWRVIKCYGFLADIEFSRANYNGTIEIIERAIDQLTVMDSLETKSVYVHLVSTKTAAMFALGRYEETHKQMDDIIRFAREQMVFDHYYSLLNAKAWMYYDEQKMEKAREYVDECRLFLRVLKHEGMTLNHEITSIFLEEFFERNYENALSIAIQVKKDIEASTEISEFLKREVMPLVLNLEARVLTRLERYEEALEGLNENPIIWNDKIQLNPMDVAIRVLSNSYEAICHYHLGNQKKAEELARYTVEKLHNMPHSSFYHFAREVLSEVMSK